MAELCFQPGKIVLPGNENLCLKRCELIGRPRGPDEGPMTAIDMLAAISGTKSLAVLDGFARNLWADWADGKLTDDQAATLAETLELRKREVRGVDTVAARAPQVSAAAKAQGRPSYFPAKRKGPTCQNRRVSIERRRTLAASARRSLTARLALRAPASSSHSTRRRISETSSSSSNPAETRKEKRK